MTRRRCTRPDPMVPGITLTVEPFFSTRCVLFRVDDGGYTSALSLTEERIRLASAMLAASDEQGYERED